MPRSGFGARWLLLFFVLLVGCSGSVPVTSSGTAPPPTSHATTVPTSTQPSVTGVSTLGSGEGKDALDMLAGLVVEDEHRQGYDRGLFDHWVDLDGDGCDTRREILLLEATQVVMSATRPCWIVSGEWYSSYDGVWVSSPGQLHIDHVVALAEAWQSGAHLWDAARRAKYANDLASLTAVTSTVNRAKGASDPADWTPPNSTRRCEYLRWWVEIKARWQLSVDQREATYLQDGLSDCAGITTPSEQLSTTTTSSAPPASAPQDPTPNPGNSKNCADFPTQVAAQTWFDRHYPSWGDVARLDNDDDQIPCEGLP